ncbi:PAS domain S-box protein [Mucilaginibacter sp. L3T2-6]|uniref:PAS domain S-box protein n=1 Tax=Mucilaginibacter sp. L3T2-6 TaxID=3062491 RepID=UPI0026753B03|nr:PAS domain S-box protein [Mucilaginibacter sp. L3T2-6]MDO3642716.1 PAS domain S-box protein [Mucilaginibacter sp. L3T2-6]MDV6215365.1 PAS domain S-box protein [Mucilaginibacter sp. L3T2-6]
MNTPAKNIPITIAALIVIVTGGVVMCGWIFDVPALQTIIPGFLAMKFNPALCFVLLGSSLLLTLPRQQKYYPASFFILSSLAFIISLLTLLQDLFHFNAGIDQLFISDQTPVSSLLPFPGRMAFNASLSFTLLGAGFLLSRQKSQLFTFISQFLFQIVVIFSAIALIGYLYGSVLFHTLFYITSMAIHTAVLFFILSVAASLLNPSIGISRLFTGWQIGNQMARRLYGLIVLMVILTGALGVHWRSPTGMFSFETVVSLLAVGFLLVSLAVIWHTAKWLNKIDDGRSEAEEKIREMNAGLEKMVQQRSAEIQRSEEKYHSLIEQASDTIYVLDTDGRFTDVNASMCKMTGYSREELLLMNIRDIVDPNEQKTDPLPDRMDNSWKPVIRERTFRHKDGTLFTVEVNVKKFTDDRIMVIARDVTDRKRMETELREAELKFRTIAEKSIVGVYIVKNGRFTYVNPRFAEVFGYEPAEMVDTFDIEQIFDESYRAIANENVRRRIKGEIESIHYEAKGHKKDGTSNWVEYYGSRAMIGGEPTIIGSMIDVTERKKAEEELKSSEQKYKLLFDSNPMPMWMISKEDQSIIAVNDAAARHYGYEKEELLHMNARALRPKEDHSLQLEGYRREMPGSESPVIVRHLKKDGTLMYVNIIAHDIIFEGKPVRLSLTNDITGKLKAEEALRKSEANLQTILNTTDTAYALFDIDLKVQAFNQKAIEFVKQQYHHDPESGDRLADYFPAERFPQFEGFAKEVLSGNNINYEIDYPQPDGSKCWYYVRLFPITNNKKEILGMMMALYDITERKNAEQDLKTAYGRIQDHINSIKDMAWKQSHLIRSPLANVKGLVMILKEDPSSLEIFDHIQSELNRMDAILIEMAKEASDHD